MNLIALILLGCSTHAAPRSSANYSITAETTDLGGRKTSSANYTNDASVTTVAGISAVASPAEAARHGYIGQLSEITGFTLTAMPPTINENATRQLGAARTLDDATLLALDPSLVSWSVLNGPLTSISAGGLATAGAVFQNTSATVQGIFEGNPGTLPLAVLNVSLDDFGTYAGDAIDDAWQVQYFGTPPNANAGPNADVSGTGQTNLFKYIAGLNPLDANSRFTLRIDPVPGQPDRKNLVFSPRFNDRTYAVKSKTDLSAASWSPLTSSSFADNLGERTVTDFDAAGLLKFYHVEITKP